MGSVMMITVGQLQIYQSKQIAARYATQFSNVMVVSKVNAKGSTKGAL